MRAGRTKRFFEQASVLFVSLMGCYLTVLVFSNIFGLFGGSKTGAIPPPPMRLWKELLTIAVWALAVSVALRMMMRSVDGRWPAFVFAPILALAAVVTLLIGGHASWAIAVTALAVVAAAGWAVARFEPLAQLLDDGAEEADEH